MTRCPRTSVRGFLSTRAKPGRPCRPAFKPASREATGRLLQRVAWWSRDRRMLDEHWSFPRTGTELPSEAEGKDPREETSAVPAYWAR